ncbi:hypothetical protein K3495_g8391 [Podosphaera aphanis]|nr:hypothetical protein K3495_g8391 [Podosphaera aphanis]
MNRPQTPPPSSTLLQSHAHSRAKKLKKDQCIEARTGTLAREGYSYQKIARRLQVTYH